MDNKDEKENCMNEERPEEESSDNDIPLWLQGLENDELEEPKPFASKEDVKDSWVPELEGSIDNDQIGDNQTDDVQLDDEELIDVPVDSLDSGINDQTTDDRENMENEPTEEIQIDELPGIDYSDDIGPSLDDLPSSEGFMDISGMDFSDVKKQEEPNIEDDALIEGDLPEWLQEMIAEEDKPKTGETELENLEEQDIIDDQTHVYDSSNLDQAPSQDEPIEEDGLAVKDDVDEDDILEEKHEITSDEEELSSIEPTSYLEETAIAIARDETTPVVISNDVDHKLPSSPKASITEEPIAEEFIAEEPIAEEPIAEEPVAEESIMEASITEEPIAEEFIAEEPIAEEPIAEEPIAEEFIAEEPIAEEPIAEEPIAEEPIAEEPKLIGKDEQLERAKRHLDQGDFDQALPIVNRLLEENIYTETLETWIKQATEREAKTTSEAWSLLGDITLRQNKPREAFDAYAKAIKYLLINDEVNDETR